MHTLKYLAAKLTKECKLSKNVGVDGRGMLIRGVVIKLYMGMVHVLNAFLQKLEPM